MSSSAQHSRTWSTVTIDLNEAPFLSLDYEDEVVYEESHRGIKYGSIVGLVEQLTRHDRLDVSFNETFLMTYPTFVSAAEFFEILLQRLNLPPPPDLTESDLHRWTEQKQKTIRFRVLNILKTWVERYWMEPPTEATMEFLRHIHAYLTSSPALVSIPACAPLLTVIENRLKGQDIMKRLISPPNTSVPKPVTPKNMKKLKLLDLDATELARQLTIIESRLYARIRPAECLNKGWQRKDSIPNPATAHRASVCTADSRSSSSSSTDPNHSGINAMIMHSNQLASWVGETILAQDEMKKRVSLIKQFVQIADSCQTLQNYATMMSLISGLGTTPIYRLRRTWSQVSPRIRSTLETMRSVMSSERNFTHYRETLRGTSPPCVPFLGIHLSDLTFTTDGNPDSTPPPESFINFQKRTKIASILHEMQTYQNMPYTLYPVAEIQEFIIRSIQGAGDMDLYGRSLEVEPRVGGEERVMGSPGGGGGSGGPYTATGSHMSSVVIASMAMRGGGGGGAGGMRWV
ncbi:ras GEF [Aspergillus ellipticus CBS 707.79]|uniref:Ras GEF n=1 Tax=Aspergillus ellipticus CBS 707.79 TaxID=1448320 RepID=A0A319DM74_9EURO|nr:ras GEF [Aspergillus ellipticus CBS 707.79]